MGKALKTAGAIIGGAVLIATGVGALAGLQVTAMGIAGVGTMSVANLQMMSAGLMAVGTMLDKPKSTSSASPTDWTSNPDQPIPFLFGRMGVSGKIVHRDEYGPDNRLQGIVSVYSGAGPVKSFQGFTADDVPVSFVSNGGTAVGKYSRQMWRSWRMGDQPDTALTLPTGLDGGAIMPAWGTAYKLSGKACDLLTLQQDSKFSVYPSGEPKPVQVLEGVYGYDPRYDDTYPGGAGPCRFGVRSTYRYIDNAIIAALNWALGMVENGQVVGGIGASLQGVHLPGFVEAANIAQANGWTVAAWPDTSEDASVVLDQLLEAGGAKRARLGGKISCISRGAPRPSIITITRRDTAGAIELDTGASAFNRLNTITPVIMSEAHKWQHAPMNPVSFPALVTEDGGKRSDQIKYRFVSQVKQGAELAAYDILDAREPFSGTIPLLPHLRRLKPGDCFDIDEPGFLLDGVKMIVLSRSYDPKLGEVRIAFRSETDSKHPLALGKTTTMPDYPGLTPADPTFVSPPHPDDWAIVPRPPGDGGTQVPIIDLRGFVSNATATAMLVEWGYPPDPPPPDPIPTAPEGERQPVWADYVSWKTLGVWPVTTTELPISGVQPGETIYIALSYQRGQNTSERDVKGPLIVPGLIADGLTPDAAQEIVRDVLGQVGDIAAGTEAAEQVAELVLETILNENDALVKEAKERGEGIAIAYQGATQYADSKIAEATYTMATIAMLDAAQAATLIQSQSYTDGTVATALNTVYTKAQVDSGLSTTLQQAKSYSDAQASEASLLYATKAEREIGDAATYASMQSYVDAYKAEANVLFAAQSSLNGVSATAALALETAQNATTKLNEARVVLIAAADGSRPAMVGLVSGPGGADAVLSADRIWFGPNTVIDTVTNIRRTTVGAVRYVEAWGLPFGLDSLTYWHGLNSVPIGSERKDNAISWEDSSGAGLYGGETLTNPFDSGASGGIIHLTGSFQNIAEASKYTRQGRFLLWPEFYHQGAGTPNGEGYAEYAVEWQIVSANAAGGDVQVLKSGPEVGQGGFGPSSWGPMLFAPPSDFIGIAHSKTGQRRIILQARLARGDIASLTNYAVKGFYAV